MVLNDYIFATQRLLHDAQAQIWPISPDLTYYINLARDRTALDTLSTRVLVPNVALPALAEQVLHSNILAQALLNPSPPPARVIVGVINFNMVQSGSYQPPMKRLAWTELNAQYRTGGPLNPAAFPEVWSPYQDLQRLFIANVPGQPITAEADALYLPNKLSAGTDPDLAILDPWSELVAMKAAAWAMYYQDDFQAAEKFNAHYVQERDDLAAAIQPFSGFN